MRGTYAYMCIALCVSLYVPTYVMRLVNLKGTLEVRYVCLHMKVLLLPCLSQSNFYVGQFSIIAVVIV